MNDEQVKELKKVKTKEQQRQDKGFPRKELMKKMGRSEK